MMASARAFGVGMVVALLMLRGRCYAGRPFALRKPTANGNSSSMKAIEIVPGKAIGDLKIGTRVDELPPKAVLSGIRGSLAGIQFLIANGIVDDVWIDDLRTFRGELHFTGKAIDRRTPLEELKALFGPCDSVPGIKGGAFFNCHAGVTLGSDASGLGEFVQIRLKPR